MLSVHIVWREFLITYFLLTLKQMITYAAFLGIIEEITSKKSNLSSFSFLFAHLLIKWPTFTRSSDSLVNKLTFKKFGNLVDFKIIQAIWRIYKKTNSRASEVSSIVINIFLEDQIFYKTRYDNKCWTSLCLQTLNICQWIQKINYKATIKCNLMNK